MIRSRDVAFAAAFGLATLLAHGQNGGRPLYRDPTAPTADRVKDLLGRMTIDEKVAQLESAINKPSLMGTHVETLVENDRLNEPLVKKILSKGIGTVGFLDEFVGVSGDAHSGAEHRNLVQAWVIKNTRLGIPVLFHGEALHGAVVKGATSFPEAVGLGSTWDPALLEQMFSTVALEERALGNVLVLAPVFDLSRDPRFGRTEEMYSEDPYLVAQMGVAAVRGLQGGGNVLDGQHVFATAKHFVHGQPENGTNLGPSDFSELTMRAIFLYPFEEAVKKAHIEAVMPSYNQTFGGIPSNANPWLLQQVLRKEWGFTGLTVSDYGAIDQLTSIYGLAATKAEAGVLAFKSGVDMELPEPSAYPGLVDALHAGTVSEAQLDEKVARVLTAKFKAGLFEHPFTDVKRADTEIGTPEHVLLARKVADKAIILLKNDHRILPLKSDSVKTIAVIGPNADKERLGGYSGLPSHYVTVLDGIKKRVGIGTQVLYAEGCRITEPDSAPNTNEFADYRPPSAASDERLMAEAVETATKADVVVLVLGGNETVAREATGDTGAGYFVYGDSDSIELPGRQNELVERLAKAGKPMVAVLLNGKAYALEQLSHHVPGIIEGWYLGQETGDAIAGVLFGDVNPSGHLPVTIARNVGQLPVYYYKKPNARLGYVMDENSPLFPFGLGLSYTTFRFGPPTVDRATIKPGGKASVSVVVTNSGDRAGDDVVQMYIHHNLNSVVQPVIALRGFKRIHLEPGQAERVSFEIGSEQLSIINAQMKRVVEPGPVTVEVGDNSVATQKVNILVSR